MVDKSKSTSAMRRGAIVAGLAVIGTTVPVGITSANAQEEPVRSREVTRVAVKTTTLADSKAALAAAETKLAEANVRLQAAAKAVETSRVQLSDAQAGAVVLVAKTAEARSGVAKAESAAVDAEKALAAAKEAVAPAEVGVAKALSALATAEAEAEVVRVRIAELSSGPSLTEAQAAVSAAIAATQTADSQREDAAAALLATQGKQKLAALQLAEAELVAPTAEQLASADADIAAAALAVDSAAADLAAAEAAGEETETLVAGLGKRTQLLNSAVATRSEMDVSLAAVAEATATVEGVKGEVLLAQEFLAQSEANQVFAVDLEQAAELAAEDAKVRAGMIAGEQEQLAILDSRVSKSLALVVEAEAAAAEPRVLVASATKTLATQQDLLTKAAVAADTLAKQVVAAEGVTKQLSETTKALELESKALQAEVATLETSVKTLEAEVVKAETAEVVKPEVVKPEVVKPEVVKPEVVKPEVVKPEVVKPEVVKPEVVTTAVTRAVKVGDSLAPLERLDSANPLAVTLRAGELPAGVKVLENGEFAGSPTKVGEVTATFDLTDSKTGAKQIRSVTFTVSKAAVVEVSRVVTGTTGQNLATSLSDQSNTKTVMADGELPKGFVLASDGRSITGLSTRPVETSVTFLVSDTSTALSERVTVNFRIAEKAPIKSLKVLEIVRGRVVASAAPIYAGRTITTEIVDGVIPDGLTLTESGSFEGTANRVGSTKATIMVTDTGTGDRELRTMVFNVAAQDRGLITEKRLAAIDTTIDPIAPVNVGKPSSFALVGGAMPTGTTLGVDGWVTGSPTTVQVRTVEIEVTDLETGDKLLRQIEFSAAETSLRTSSTSRAVKSGELISKAVPQFLGTNFVAELLPSSVLPEGVSLMSDGTFTRATAIDTSAQASETFMAEVMFVDSVTGRQELQQVTIVVEAAEAAPATVVTGDVGTVPGAIVPQSGAAPTSASIVSGQLPTGLTLETDGSFSGSAEQVGIFAAEIQVTNLTTNEIELRTVQFEIGEVSNASAADASVSDSAVPTQLALTGSETWAFSIVGVGLIVVGAAAVTESRRRRREFAGSEWQ